MNDVELTRALEPPDRKRALSPFVSFACGVGSSFGILL